MSKSSHGATGTQPIPAVPELGPVPCTASLGAEAQPSAVAACGISPASSGAASLSHGKPRAQRASPAFATVAAAGPRRSGHSHAGGVTSRHGTSAKPAAGAAAPSGSSWQPGTSWVRAGERGLGSALPQRSHTDPTQMVSRTCIPLFPRWGARCPLLAGLAHPSQQGPSLTQGSAPTPGASLAQGMSLARVVSLAQGAFLAQGTHLCCSTPQTCSALGSAGSVSQLRWQEGPSCTSRDAWGWSWAVHEEQDLSSQMQNPLCPTSLSPRAGCQGSLRCPRGDGHPRVPRCLGHWLQVGQRSDPPAMPSALGTL